MKQYYHFNTVNYKWHDKKFKQQFINGINDAEFMQEIIEELTAQRNIH